MEPLLENINSEGQRSINHYRNSEESYVDDEEYPEFPAVSTVSSPTFMSRILLIILSCRWEGYPPWNSLITTWGRSCLMMFNITLEISEITGLKLLSTLFWHFFQRICSNSFPNLLTFIFFWYHSCKWSKTSASLQDSQSCFYHSLSWSLCPWSRTSSKTGSVTSQMTKRTTRWHLFGIHSLKNLDHNLGSLWK